MSAADRILEMATADPRRALDEARSHLEDVEAVNAAERAQTLRAMSLAARYLNRIEESIELARSSAGVAREAGLHDLHLHALLTLSGSMAIAGRVDEAMRVIGRGIATAQDRHLRARFVFQKGALLSNQGRLREAMAQFEEALPVFRQLGDGHVVSLTLSHLGLIHTETGQLGPAEDSLLEALEISRSQGDNATVAGILHNLGELAAYQGDIPNALTRLIESDETYMALSGAGAPQHVGRCEVLISAGLFVEAGRLALAIAASSHQLGDAEHEANALLVAAHATLLGGDAEQAARLAAESERMFGEQDAPARVMEARRVVVEAWYQSEGASPGLLAEAERLAAELEAEGLVVASAQARLLAGKIAIDLGDLDAARFSLDPVSSITTGPVELRLQARLARALLRRAGGDMRGAAAAVRSGMDLLDRFQAAIGATDLRMGLERQGAELARIGLDLAIEAANPRRILHWMDRSRARSLRHPPVVPSGEDETQDLLQQLRQVDARLRDPEHRADAATLRQRRRIQEQISRADRIRKGSTGDRDRVEVGQIIESLGDRALVEIAIHRERLLAIVVVSGRARRVELGGWDEMSDELRRVRFALRRAARLGRGLDLSALERVDRLLAPALSLDSHRIVVVPTPPLMALPWAVLPSAMDRSVTVAPSAELWWRAGGSASRRGPVALVAGPDLEQADEEVAALASLYPGAGVLPSDATVEEAKTALARAGIAHLACHASFAVENPMFSALRLGDGDLNVYDLERLKAAPSVVVLSACDSGYTEAREGDELAGLTSALLRMGTRTVIASVGLVPDSRATTRLMVALHRGLTAGLEPATALATAQKEVMGSPAGLIAAASFICVGA